MRGGVLSIFSFFSIIVFSVCLLTSNNLGFFWLFMELCTLSLVPAFFICFGRNVLSGLFSYLVVSSVSSSFIMSGILCESFLFLTVLGFFIKFGIFPFFGWVYSVMLKTNTFVVWAFSTLLKIPFISFPFFLNSGLSGSSGLEVLFILSFVVLSFLFWVYSYDLLYCWTHMMLSSSAVLIVCSFVISLDSLFYLYLIYFIWSSWVVFFISRWGLLGITGISVSFFFVFLFLSYPFSLSLFYKLLTGVCIYSCSFGVFVAWVLYSVSEQWYLFSFFIGTSIPQNEVGVLSFI